jgi:AcrR family transcriptional regulator
MTDTRPHVAAQDRRTAPDAPGRRPRGSITPDDVIAAAFDLATDISLASLNMPKLARHLDVPVTSIYWHFRKKEQLLDAMLDHAVREYHLETTFVDAKTWDEALRTHFRQMRDVFRQNPVLCDLVLMRVGELSPDATRTAIGRIEAVVETLVEAGFTPDDALEVYLALSVHSRGSALVEHLARQQGTGGAPMSTRVMNRGVVGADFLKHASPTAMKVATLATMSTATTPRHDPAGRGDTVADTNFEFTLDALIDKAKRLLDRTPAASDET